MRRGVVLVALVGGFVGATTLPAAAQYWEDNAVGLNIGFGPPVYSAPSMAPPSMAPMRRTTTRRRRRHTHIPRPQRHTGTARMAMQDRM
jgi:hypothetical protein